MIRYLTLNRTELCNPYILEKYNFLFSSGAKNRDKNLHSFLSMSFQQKQRSLFGEHTSMMRSDHCFPFKMQLFLFCQHAIQLSKNLSCAQYPAILFHLLSEKQVWHQHFCIKNTHQENVIHCKLCLLFILTDWIIGYLPHSLFCAAKIFCCRCNLCLEYVN